MADKAPKFARTPLSPLSHCPTVPLSDLSDLSDLSGAWHLLGRGGPAVLTALAGVCPVPGTCCRAVSAWFASIDRPVCPVPGTCWPGGSWHLLPGGFCLVCQHWTAICPVPGTC